MSSTYFLCLQTVFDENEKNRISEIEQIRRSWRFGPVMRQGFKILAKDFEKCLTAILAILKRY